MNISKWLGIFASNPTHTPSGVPDTAKEAAIQPRDSKMELVATFIIRSMEIIIDAVSSDFERAKGFIEKDPVTGQLFPKQPPLPTSWENKSDWETPVIIDGKFTAELKSEVPNMDIHNSPSKNACQKEPQPNGTFLLDFHTAFHSNEERFNIEVKPTNRALNIVELGAGRAKQLKIVWAVLNKTQNNIYVKHRNIVKPTASTAVVETSEVETSHLFTFWDHEVNPRVNQKISVDINEIFSQAHPSLGRNYLDGIPYSLKNQIDNLSPLLLRAFYATTSQKIAK